VGYEEPGLDAVETMSRAAPGTCVACPNPRVRV
jgi:hypothetical protein